MGVKRHLSHNLSFAPSGTFVQHEPTSSQNLLGPRPITPHALVWPFLWAEYELSLFESLGSRRKFSPLFWESWMRPLSELYITQRVVCSFLVYCTIYLLFRLLRFASLNMEGVFYPLLGVEEMLAPLLAADLVIARKFSAILRVKWWKWKVLWLKK